MHIDCVSDVTMFTMMNIQQSMTQIRQNEKKCPVHMALSSLHIQGCSRKRSGRCL